MNIQILFLTTLSTIVSLTKCRKVGFQRFEPVDSLKPLQSNGMKYSIIFCYQRIDESDAGKVFKIFVERKYHKRPCQILIPSRVFVYLFVNFHFSSIAAVISGNAEINEELSHVSGIVMPRMHEPTIHGPIYAPCNHSQVLYRSLDLRDSLLFAFIIPSKEYIARNSDPETCHYGTQNPQLRKAIGYVQAPWLNTMETIEVMLEKLNKIWANHTSTLPEYNS